MHSVYSDGSLTAGDLVRRAKRVGLASISITDHDNTAAIGEATEIGLEIGVEVIPGVELSARVDSSEVHILGYFFDFHAPELLDYLSQCRNDRVRRAERIVEKLNGMNVPLKLEAVLDQAGSGSVGRPHIAHALVEEGLAESYSEAFYKYIGYGRPAYEEKPQISPREAISLIASAGGLSFVAHPGKSLDETVLLELIRSKVDGIEVIHPSHSADLVQHYRGIVNEYCLLESGGSDFHGSTHSGADPFGKFSISEECVEMMRRRLQ